jgi:hypothetical protein
MPVYPFTPEPLVKSGHYPHFSKHDGEVWERFLDQFSASFERVVYDVALGGVAFEGGDPDDRTARAWRYATAMKVDAVLIGDGRAWAVEVRPYARAGALGNALCYAEMLEMDNPTGLDVVAAVVSDEVSPDVRWCADRLGVHLFEVGRATPPSPLDLLEDPRPLELRGEA